MTAVIPSDRQKTANAIAAYLRGEIDNFALDDATLGYKGNDEAIWEIGLGLWGAYDDIRCHHVILNEQGWKAFRRCIAFLQTDLEIPKRGDSSDPSVWPFQDRRQIFSARPNMKAFQLPRYNPQLHNIPLRSKVFVALIWGLWTLIALALLLRLMTALASWFG